MDPILNVYKFSFLLVCFSQVDISITPGTHASEDAGNTHFCSQLFSLFMIYVHVSYLVHAVGLLVYGNCHNLVCGIHSNSRSRCPLRFRLDWGLVCLFGPIWR